MGYYPSPVYVLAVSKSEGRMDCCDDGSAKVWVVVTGWSTRRAVLTHAEPFLKASGYTDPYALEGMHFFAKMDLGDPPPFDHEGGERIEFPELEIAPPIAEIHAELGMAPPEEPEERKTTFSPDFASTHLRAWLGSMDSNLEGTATQVMVEADDLCYLVNGVRYDSTVGVELLLDPVAFFRDGDDEEDDEYEDDKGLCLDDLPDYVMNFSEAAGWAEDRDCTISREEWEEQGLKLALRWDSDRAALMFFAPDEEPRVWSPTQVDVLAGDWFIVAEDKTES